MEHIVQIDVVGFGLKVQRLYPVVSMGDVKMGKVELGDRRPDGQTR
jgi:hypothetical protein